MPLFKTQIPSQTSSISHESLLIAFQTFKDLKLNIAHIQQIRTPLFKDSTLESNPAQDYIFELSHTSDVLKFMKKFMKKEISQGWLVIPLKSI